MRYLRLLPLLVVLGLVIAGAAAALAADDPGTQTKVLSDPSVDASQTRLSAQRDGTAIAGWRELRGSDEVARLAFRDGDGAWRVEPPITAPGDVEQMAVALAAGGVAAATWERFAGEVGTVQVAVRDRTGSWSISTPPSGPDLHVDRILPAVSIRDDGSVVAAWLQGTDRSRVAEYAIRGPDGSWSEPATISTLNPRSQPILVSRGATTAVAFVAPYGARRAVFLSSLGLDGRFSEPVRISVPGDLASPVLAVEHSGVLAAAWARSDGEDWIVQVSERGEDGAFSKARVALTVAGASSPAPRLRLVVTENGRMAVGALSGGGFRGAYEQVSARDADGTWEARDRYGAGAILSFDLFEDGEVVQSFGSDLSFEKTAKSGSVRKTIDTCSEDSGYCITPARPSVAALADGHVIATWFEQHAHRVVVVGIADDVPPPPAADVTDDTTDASSSDGSSDSTDETGAGFHVTADGRVRVAITCRATRPCVVGAQLDALRLPGGTRTLSVPRRLVSVGRRQTFAFRLAAPVRAELARSGKLHARLWVHQRVGSRTRLDRRDVLLTAR